jgi:hypothetical protein
VQEPAGGGKRPAELEIAAHDEARVGWIASQSVSAGSATRG